MKKITVLAFCFSSLSLYSSYRPTLEQLKNGCYTVTPTENIMSDDEDSAFQGVVALEEKGFYHLTQALGKLSRRGHNTQRRNSREVLHK